MSNNSDKCSALVRSKITVGQRVPYHTSVSPAMLMPLLASGVTLTTCEGDHSTPGSRLFRDHCRSGRDRDS